MNRNEIIARLMENDSTVLCQETTVRSCRFLTEDHGETQNTGGTALAGIRHF